MNYLPFLAWAVIISVVFEFRVFLHNGTWTAHTVICLFWPPKLPGPRSRSSGLHTVASLPPEHRGMEILILRVVQKLTATLQGLETT